jgi:twitching motility two-component system response regulator PilH
MTSGKILVADDSPNIREILQMNLEAIGYSVIVAEDGERALQQLDSEHPDLMIVDVMMPKVNGFQICRRVKSNPATDATPVVLLTARSQEEDVFWGKDCGADAYITKPFSTKELEKTIARLLRQREARQAGLAEGARGELVRRRQEGTPGEMIALEWDTRIMDVFRKKYGEIKFSEALHALRAEAEKYLEDHHDEGPVDVHEAFGLYVVLKGNAEEALQAAQDMASRLSVFAATFYADEDRARGHISLRDPRSGREEKLPLLSFTARLDAASPAA